MARAVNTVIDSLNFFVESRNAGNILISSATVSASALSADIQNTLQFGAMFFVAISSVSVSSATVQFVMNVKDVSTSVYYPYFKTSVDGLSAGAPGQMVMMYVAASAGAPFITGTNQLINLPVPGTFQVVTSMTISNTTATNTGTTTLRIDYAKVM